MKIVIIGAGLSGLTAALALQKYLPPKLPSNDPLEIKIYDESETKAPGTVEYSWRDHSDIHRQQKAEQESGNKKKNQGAAISLQQNAFKSLREIDPDLANRVHASGLPCKGFTWKSRGDWLLGREDLEACLISRPVIVGILMEALCERGVRVVYRSVREVECREGVKPVVRFLGEDDEEEVADLVVGADGIRSVVRKSVFGDREGVRPVYLYVVMFPCSSDSPPLLFGPGTNHHHYSGNCAVGGILDLPKSTPLPETYFADPRITFIHGPTGTFGYGGLSQTSPNKIIFFSFYDSDLPARGSKPDPQQVTEALRKRHQGWADPMIAQCLAQTDAIDTVYPIFYMPDLPSWGRDGCVLVGDAAHAMTPATGQGGSQAIEDGLTLALLLRTFIEVREGDHETAIRDIVPGLHAIRAEHVYAIKRAGLAIKEPARPWGWLTTLAVYGFYFVMTKVKLIKGLFGEPVYPAHLFDVRGEVERYVDARSR